MKSSILNVMFEIEKASVFSLVFLKIGAKSDIQLIHYCHRSSVRPNLNTKPLVERVGTAFKMIMTLV